MTLEEMVQKIAELETQITTIRNHARLDIQTLDTKVQQLETKVRQLENQLRYGHP